MTYPTPEDIKQIAIECGAIVFADGEDVVYAIQFSPEELQAFATRFIEIGRKMQRESDANLEVPSLDSWDVTCRINTYRSAISNNTRE